MEKITDYGAFSHPYGTGRLGKMRDLVIQIEADYRHFVAIKRKIDAGLGENSDREELLRLTAWLKMNIAAYAKLNAMSIEGVTCPKISSIPPIINYNMQ